MKHTLHLYKLSSFALGCLLMSYLAMSVFLVMKNKSIFIEWELYSINSISIVMSVILDWKSVIFLLVVSMISMFIMIYSVYYMEGDKNYTRFIFMLLSFVLSMMFLIISPNLLSLMLGWDGLGLTSYALVTFYQNEYSANSGMITILSNRVGDATIMMAIGWMLHMGSYNFVMMNKIDLIIMCMIVLSAYTKSAQIPFSVWLPAAMAAPTPVSALVHSSTLVTAGVFLMIRFLPVFTNNNLLLFILMTGAATTILAGWSANFEGDLKKVIALSTLSQLGLMFLIIGAKQELLAFFHLIMHALFKSSLFMCAGFMIHNMMKSQDSRFSSYFSFKTPLLGLIFGGTNLSLCGFPFLTGFFSKDLILEKTFSNYVSNFVLIMVIVGVGLTLSYSLRVIYMTSSVKSGGFILNPSTDFSSFMFMSIIFLYLMGTMGGFALSWTIVYKSFMFSMTSTEKFFIIMILLLVVLSMLAIMSYPGRLNPVLKWSFTLMLNLPAVTKILSVFFLKKIPFGVKLSEKGWLEYTGPTNSANFLKKTSSIINKTNSLVLITQYAISFFFVLLIAMMMS